MKKWLIISLVLTIILIVIGTMIIFQPKENKKNFKRGGGTPLVFGVAEEQDYLNFKEIIQNNQMISDLPEDSTLMLSFYNFYSGEREWEKSYVFSKDTVNEGTIQEYDLKLIMHSKYLTILKKNNLCNVIKLAKKRGDFASETSLSTIKLAWKFKSMMDYKDCLGL